MNSGIETIANSTTAVPRSFRERRPRSLPPRERRWDSRTDRDAGGAAGVGAPSTMSVVLQLRADAAERRLGAFESFRGVAKDTKIVEDRILSVASQGNEGDGELLPGWWED